MSERPLARHLTKDVDPKAIDEVWHRIEAKRARPGRSLERRALVGVLAVVALLFVLRGVWRGADTSAAVRLASGAALPASLVGAVDLDDGSRVIVSTGAMLAPAVNTAHALVLAQTSGTVTFDVKPHGPRAWTVDTGLARVQVIGTRFRVLREPHLVRVDVERGIVLVTSELLASGQRRLTEGESVEVSDTRAAPPVTAPSATLAQKQEVESATPVVQASALPAAPTRSVAPATTAAPWRPLVEKGDYGAAYDALGRENVAAETTRASSASDLQELADVARISGHPRDAVAPLERLVALHRTDPRAATAAFTLGKVQLDALAAPAAAAAAFETAIAIGLPAALREDAFARRVEAYASAGDSVNAKLARTAYDGAFSTGRHREAVARWAP